MAKMPLVHAITADVLGAGYHSQDDTVSVTFVLQDGDHLHVSLSRAGFENLSRHIRYVDAVELPRAVRPKGNRKP